MAYPHYMQSVQLLADSASTANTIVSPTTSSRVGGVGSHGFNVTNGDNWGCAYLSAGLIGLKVHAMGLESNTNFTDTVPVYLRRRTGAATAPEASLLTLLAPTTAATGPIVMKYATQNIVVAPGTKLFISVSTAIADIRANTYLLVSPVWEERGNATAGIASPTG